MTHKQELTRRWGELIDKKYQSGLTENEEREKDAIDQQLNEMFAAYYAPVLETLREMQRLADMRRLWDAWGMLNELSQDSHFFAYWESSQMWSLFDMPAGEAAIAIEAMHRDITNLKQEPA